MQAALHCCVSTEGGWREKVGKTYSGALLGVLDLAGASLGFLLQPRDAISVFQALRLEKTWNRFYRKIYAAAEDKRAHAPNYCSPVSSLKSNSVA